MRQVKEATSRRPDAIVCPSCGSVNEWTEYERRGQMIWAYPSVKRLEPPVGEEEENPVACPACEEETRVSAGRKVVSRRLAKADVPDRFREYSLDRVIYQEQGEHIDDFKVRAWKDRGVYGVCHADLDAFRTCVEWVRYMKGTVDKNRGPSGPRRPGSSLFIHGEVGVGKSLLAAILLSELVKGGHKTPVSEVDYAGYLAGKWGVSYESAMKEIEASRCGDKPIAWTAERSYSCLWLPEAELLRRESLSWKGDQSPLYRAMKHRGPICLDDFDSDGGGKAKPREWAVRAVERAISLRYDRRLPYIVSSNSSMEQVRKSYGERVYSRIRETCEPVYLSGGGDEWRR